jgi:hypothetical protein
MKRSLVVFVIFSCIVSVVGGHFYYNNKLEQTASAARLEMEPKPKTEKKEVKNKKADEQKIAAAHFKNAPAGLAELYQQKQAADESLVITLVGSESTSDEEGTWAKRFANQMSETYGNDVEVQIVSFGDTTSWEVPDQAEYSELMNRKTDVVLIEPFLLNDNGEIRVEDTLIILNLMIADLKEANPEVVILLQPSNPISKPKYYADQIAGVKEYAEKNGIPFLDYWESWPSVNSTDIFKYYDQNTYLPNEEGHKLWADYMYNVFK